MTRIEQIDHLRIIAERRHCHWTAWFSDQPTFAYGARWPAEAVEKLLAAHPERKTDRESLTTADEYVRDDHLEFWLSPRLETLCSECKGTGKYVGLLEVECCRACGGSGTAAASAWDISEGDRWHG